MTNPQTDDTIPLAELAAGILAHEDPTLGITAEEARGLTDRIESEMGWAHADDDDPILRAYDLLHSRAVHGRAF
jgi:hypothetical protein